MKRKSEAGQAIASVALGLVVLTGIVGLAIDMGYLRYEKRRMQSAADSAAIAGASELAYATGNSVTAAKNDSKANGFEDGVNGVTVTSSNPPVDAPFSSIANANNYVEVKVQQSAPTFFMRIFGLNSINVSAAAVAHLGSSPGCVYSLNRLLGGISLGGNNLTATGCNVVDNAMLDLSLGGCVNAGSIGVGLNILGTFCGAPNPVTGMPPSSDPLGYLIAPAVGACLPNPNINQPAGPPVVLPPGTYCGITVNPANVAPIVFSPGLFVVTGAPGLQIQGPSTATGTGVVFFMTNGAGVQITGPGNTSLTAPTDTTGGIPGGVLFFQDRTNVQPATITNPNLSLTGALYFPGALLILGPTSASPYLILVADALKFLGPIAVGDPITGNNYSSLTNGSPIKAAVLVQ